ENLLNEVNCLVEWPSAVLCSFEKEFLAVPQETLITTMETNQKFFSVFDNNGKLSEKFIGIANIESTDVEQVRKGYERVIRPRFADAKFFYDEDLKQGIASMADGLTTVTYQQKLGSYADKTQRIAKLAEAIAGVIDTDAAQAKRAAELCKADLQSRMVGEFPELQGVAGRYYAKAAGEPEAVANAIDEAYQPRFSGDAIAPSKIGQVLAIAERLDTLAGGFAAGLKPTGNKDAFALRRNALGLARTLIEGGIDIPLKIFIKYACALNALYETTPIAGAILDAVKALNVLGVGVGVDKNQVWKVLEELVDKAKPDPEQVEEIYLFVLDRMRNYYADQGFNSAQFDAVAELKPASLLDFDKRLKAVREFAQLPEAPALAAANKRIRNILRKVEGEIPSSVNADLLQEQGEKDLHAAVTAALADTDTALASRDYVAVLSRLATLRPQVDAFFDSVMVNVDDVAVRDNRLALLKTVADRFASVAEIAALVA
ncbi:MAG: glycine--tRNA ligase subunit beta, partial [Methylococcales bacterium]